MNSKWSPQDHPWSINLVLLVLVVIHAVPSVPGWLRNVWQPLIEADPALASALYLSFVGAAAIVAGFAGVVVIFGLSGTSDKFRQFRVEGKEPLARNWTSTFASGFIAAALSLAAAVCSIAGAANLAPWFFELAVLISIHGTLRLMWLMRGLVHAVTADDTLKEREAQKKQGKDAPWHRKAS